MTQNSSSRRRSFGLTIWLLVNGLALQVAAQDLPVVRYEIDLAQRAHHLARVTVHFPEQTHSPERAAEILEVRMSRSSPGRYALHEFAKNVYDVQAEDAAGKILPVSRVSPHEWHIAHRGEVTFRYTLFANRTDGTYSAIDRSHAHLNIPATFAWARGYEFNPISVLLENLDSGWRISTQMLETENPALLTAPNFQFFMDSPIEASDHPVYDWLVGQQTIRVALHHQGTEQQAAAYVERVQRIVEETGAVFGDFPSFDNGTYTFLADYLPFASDDGMEHRNSTVLTNSGNLADNAINLLGTVAHEFVHAWSIERLRPATLEPFNFERANMSGELWFGEGFTSYYDDLLLKRAGIINLDRFAERLTAPINAVLTTPSRRHRSPVQMSQQAPFVDAASSIDPTNWANNYLSYYTYGAALGAGLDLWLRVEFERSLDQFMQLLWQKYGKEETPYTLTDLEDTLGDLIADPSRAKDFFSRHVKGSDLPDYTELLRAAGLELRQMDPARAFLGDNAWKNGKRGVLVASTVLETSPLYPAGVVAGDELLMLDDRKLKDEKDLRRTLQRLSPGDSVQGVFAQREDSSQRTAAITLASDPQREIVPIEHLGQAVTPAIRNFRDRWLSSKAAPSGQTDPPHTHCHVCGRLWPGEYEFCPIDGSSLHLTPLGSIPD